MGNSCAILEQALGAEDSQLLKGKIGMRNTLYNFGFSIKDFVSNRAKKFGG